MGSKGRYLKKCSKPCWPIRSKETWAKYKPTTLLSQRKLALTEKYYFCIITSYEQVKILKNGPLFRPRTNYTSHQKPNPSCETIPLSLSSNNTCVLHIWFCTKCENLKKHLNKVKNWEGLRMIEHEGRRGERGGGDGAENCRVSQ